MMFKIAAAFLLVLVLLAFPAIRGETSGEREGSGVWRGTDDEESSGEEEGTDVWRGTDDEEESSGEEEEIGEARACPGLPSPANGWKTCYVVNNNFHCKFYCDNHFIISGDEERWCQSSGSWSGNITTCKRVCSELPVLENGTMRCTDVDNIGSTCDATCDQGFELFGSKWRSCKYSSWPGWTGKDVTCQGSPPTPSFTCFASRLNVCDGGYHCEDNSDENGCTCPSYKFKCDCYDTGCQSRWGCIKQSWVCDGKNHCGDWSDERDCQCSDTRFQCKHGDCIDRLKVNDGNLDCLNGDDEFICSMTKGHANCDCLNENEQCTSSGRCIPSSWIGDTIPDCENHSDEPCNASKIWCSGCWVIINQCSTNQSKNALLRNLGNTTTKCRSLIIPLNHSLVPETSWICTTSPCGKCQETFRCDSGQFTDKDQFCDKIPQCEDGSDELTKNFGFRCSGKSGKGDCILPQKNVYDSSVHCADSSDLCFVNGEFRCFSCLDGKLIVSAKQVCDGRVDCYDMSDECLCANQSVCNAVLGEEMSRCPSNQMHCNSDKDCVDMKGVLCNSSIDCTNGRNQRFCHQDNRSSEAIRCLARTRTGFNITRNAARCDGRPECARMEDECNCEPRPSFCNGTCASTARSHFYGNLICDGYLNRASEPELRWKSSCTEEVEKNCPMRFSCKSKDMISIDKRSLCDGILDCDDHSDEKIVDCSYKRFYCSNGNAISIDKDFVCNGINDCDKGEDEVEQLCGENVSLFSDQYEMISSPILRVLFWIMGIFALGGNIIVNVYTAKDVFFGKRCNDVKLANDIFILNLTISDFLMGIYLIAVVAQGTRYSGSYGLNDKEWRSGIFCQRIGTLAVLSSETSALLMVAMSTFRLVTVYYPYLSSSIKIKWIVLAASLSWILSFLLASTPWFPIDSGYFISDTWFPNAFFKTDTVSKSDMFGLAQRISVDKSNLTSWLTVKRIISNAFKYNPIKGEFGYYGKTSVCMPRFYVFTNEDGWEYSIFLITFNFVLFIYMMIAYLLVYKKASNMKNSRSVKNDPNKGLQKRLSRLLLTDFCCWIPVCIMGYLSFAGVSLPVNAYVATGGFLLPINSAMNPIVYSKLIGRYASQAKKEILQKISSVLESSVDEVNVGERHDIQAEKLEMKVIEDNH